MINESWKIEHGKKYWIVMFMMPQSTLLRLMRVVEKYIVNMISLSKIRNFFNLNIWNEFLVAKACKNESNVL